MYVRTCVWYMHVYYVVIDSFGMAYLLWHLFIHCFMGISLQSDHLCTHIRLLVCVCMCACTFLVPNSSATCIQSNYVGITLCTHHSASPYTLYIVCGYMHRVVTYMGCTRCMAEYTLSNVM